MRRNDNENCVSNFCSHYLGALSIMLNALRMLLLLLLVACGAAAATIAPKDAQDSAAHGSSSSTQQLSPALPCEVSGMCSLGKVKPFIGDIVTSSSLRSCLEARSFRREIILLTETRLNPAYQTFRSLLAVGYEHVVLLSSLERCGRSNATWPRLGCVWSGQRLLSGSRYLLDRIAFMTRSARLGYNLLMLDSDVIPLRDVYSLLWAPPFGEAQLLAMRDGNGWLNCGVVYVRNARPDGPAVYVLAEVLDRLERWAAQPQFFVSRGLNAHCWDQQMYSDTLLSAVAGRPLSYGCWMRHDPALRHDWDAAHIAVLNGTPGGLLEQRHNLYLRSVRLQWPPELQAAAPDYPLWGGAQALTATLRVPNSGGVWPPELGGPLYPPQRGETSQEWMDILRADGGPLWPDPEDPSQAAVAASLTEAFAYLPFYLAESWSQGGAFGYWNSALRQHQWERGRQQGQQPQGGNRPASHSAPVALAHFVHVPGGATNKLTVKMATNNWDWDVAHAAHPNRGVFFASVRTAPVPDVLALAPEVVSREWADEAVFGEAALALLRLAMETGRAAAYPAPRCNVSWMGGDANNKLPLAVHHGFHIPYSPAGRGFDDLRCLWGGYLQHGCQAVRPYFSGGLLAPEYDHLLDLLHQDNNGGGSSDDGSGSAARRSAARLESLGFTVEPGHMAVAPGGGGVGGGGRGSSGEVVTVPLEVLQPPPSAEAWDVTELADALMQRYGGPGSGLLYVVNLTGGSGGVSSSRPRVLVLPEVPKLTSKLGPRHAMFKQELESGPDRAFMSCDWVRTGRPYRRRRSRRLSRRRQRRRRQLLEGNYLEDAGDGSDGDYED